MENLTVDKDKILKAYATANATGKKLLEQLHGKEIFIPDELTHDVDGAYKLLKINRTSEIPFKKPTTDRQIVANARFDIDIVVEALQNRWVADYDDPNQKKWFPIYIKLKGGGFGFGDAFYVCDGTYTYGGAQLAFPDERTAIFFGKQFIDLMNIVLLKPKSQHGKSN